MRYARLGNTGLMVSELCLGCMTFGQEADEETSRSIVGRFLEAGGNFVDTADVYSNGVSEEITGRALQGVRDDVVLATKVGAMPARKGLAADNVKRACEDSLARLGTDRVDLYFAHFDDEGTPLEETFGAFEELVQEGKVLAYALSNYTPERLRAALEVAPGAAALQPEYNLVEREGFEAERQAIAREHELAVVPYAALASGFLSGKYRPEEEAEGEPSPRGGRARRYLEDPNGRAVLEALDAVAEETDKPVSAVALAWLAAQDTVLAPIASARTPEQLQDLLAVGDLELTDDQLERLTAASA